MLQYTDVIDYDNHFLTKNEADKLFHHLLTFQQLTRMMQLEISGGEKITYNFGKMIFLNEELLTNNAFPESIWGNTIAWSKEMLSVKKRIENYANHEFKTCVCIYYPDGNSGIAYHADEIAFGDTSIIPSISLGAERPFNLREKKSLKESTIILEHGSLLTMKNGCQEHFEHSLPLNSSYKNPRINLTFRQYGFDNQL